MKKIISILYFFTTYHCFGQHEVKDSFNINSFNYCWKGKYLFEDYCMVYQSQKDSTIKFIKIFADSNYTKLYMTQFFIKDNMYGPCKIYVLDKLVTESFYINNKLNGGKYFYDNNEIYCTEMYKEDKLISKSCY